MKTLTRSLLSILILFIQFFMAGGAFATPEAADQSRPDLVLRIHGLIPALKVVDDIAGATGSQVSPSLLLGGMLQGTAWIDSSKDIVLGAWFDPEHPEAQPVMGALVPFASENAGFASAYHAKAGGSYYLISLPPGNPKPLSEALESALAKESMATSGRFLSMEISLSHILKNADPIVEKWAGEVEKKIMAGRPGSSPSITPDQARKMVSGLVDLGKQVKRLAVGIDINKSEASFFMSVKGGEGSRLNGILTKKGAPGESRLVNLSLPGNYPIRFSVHPFSNKDIIGFLNDSLGGFYKSIGINPAETGKIMKYFTGETVGGMRINKDAGIEMSVAAVFDDKEKRKPDFLQSVYIPWLMDYGKNMAAASKGALPGERFAPNFTKAAESRVSGHRTLGVKGWLPVMSAPGAKAEKKFFSIRMTVLDGLLLAASDDRRLGELIAAAKDLKSGPATGPFFEARMRATDLISPGGAGNPGRSGAGELIMTVDIRDGELVIEYKTRIADIKTLAASAMKGQKQQTPSAGEQSRSRSRPKIAKTEKKHELTPGEPEYWINKGSLYSSYGNENAAVKSFKKALKLDPQAVEAEFKLGVSYGALRDYDKALKHMNTALSKSPENGRFLYGRAWIYLLSGQRDKAMIDMKAAAQKGNPDAMRYLVRPQ